MSAHAVNVNGVLWAGMKRHVLEDFVLLSGQHAPMMRGK